MTTSCECVSNIPNFCLLQGKVFGDAPKDKDRAIEAYTYCITETKRCLSFTENPLSKEKLCKQIAIGYNERGFMKYQKVDFDDAIADYSKALSYDGSLYFTYYNRGLIHYRLGRYDEAISDMKEALSIQPDFEPAQQCMKQANTDKQAKVEHHSEPHTEQHLEQGTEQHLEEDTERCPEQHPEQAGIDKSTSPQHDHGECPETIPFSHEKQEIT